MSQFRQQVLLKINYLSEKGQIYVPDVDPAVYIERQKQLAIEMGGIFKEKELSSGKQDHYILQRQGGDYDEWGIQWMKSLGLKE